MPDIKRVFIANRGEICGRIATTARRLGIETVALSERTTPPTYLSSIITSFIQVEEEKSSLYLDPEKMVAFAKESGCDAIHPGFGFLSENANFAAQVLAADLTWIGPTPDSITKMASKSTARTIALKAGVPCIEGLQDFDVPETVDGDFGSLEKFAKKIGYPLLIKASMGGGGKGMRLVEKESQLKESALRACSEAKNSFGSGSLICERYVETPRHIEVQILGDRQGHVFAIGDRDCSVQRRHQKILEEAPAIGLSDLTRRKLHECAIRLAKTVNYQSAGTVEFLLDWSDASKAQEDQSFYFLEMNTRLQVEHPVTEEVFGIDLVEWQFRIANGQELPNSFSQLIPMGHSVEARIYAEDVGNDFFPAPGPVRGFVPASGPGIRWEVGVETIDEISPKFDPMVAKLIATGADRSTAMGRLAAALRQTFFAAASSNQEFLLEICSNSQFKDEPVGTHFIKCQFDLLQQKISETRSILEASATIILDCIETFRGQLRHHHNVNSLTVENPTVTSITKNAFYTSCDNDKLLDNLHRITVGLQSTVTSGLNQPSSASLGQGTFCQDNGNPLSFWYSYMCTKEGKVSTISIAGHIFTKWTKPFTWTEKSDGPDLSTEIVAPVPGKVIEVAINVGDSVKKGQTMFILESMKMEFEVKAARSGTINAIGIKKDDQVATGEPLANWSL